MVTTDKEKIIHRLKIAEGHIRAIQKMVEEDKYCIDIIIQSKAVQSALKNVDAQILENHLNTCLISQIKNGKEEKAVTELLKIIKND